MKNQNAINLFVLGFGKVGQALVKQILSARDLLNNHGMNLHIVGLSDSRALLYRDEGLTAAQIQSALTHKGQGQSLEIMDSTHPVDSIDRLLKPGDILVDTTASPHTTARLLRAVEVGSGIVLANKIPLCGPWEETQKLFTYPNIKYEATVGAGLPVITTLKYLLSTGDSLQSIVGCLSGTLGYLCSCLEEGLPYSQAVKDARSLGYTEPDPRQDLSGMDVARKAVILSRTAGIPVELSDLSVEPLYPTELEKVSVEEFLQLADQEDAQYAGLVNRATAEQKAPRYTARITPEGIQVGLDLANKASPLGSLKGPDNYIAFQTNRYSASPLVISGPGAGIEVTAAGVFGDILQLARESHRRS